MNIPKGEKRRVTPTASIAAIIAITFSSVSLAYADGHLVIDSVSVQPNSKSRDNSNNPNTKIRVTIETAAAIPTDGASGAFGYAVLTESGNGAELSLDNVLVLVTHVGLDDSDFEDPISGFHTHVLDLMAPSTACAGVNADVEVDLVGSGGNAGFDLNTNWKVIGNVAKIGPAPIRFLNTNPFGAPGVEAVASFTVTPVLDPDLHLCVFLVDAIVP